MTPAATPPETGTRADHPQPGRRRVLATLCATEIVSWGVLYYAFPVLLTDISTDTGWSKSLLTAGFSAGLLTAAVVGIPVGRWLDRYGPRWIMSGGSILTAPALALIAAAPSPPVFVCGWLLAGVAMGAVLYPPAFAAVTRWYGPQRVRALTTLTLAAGLASTVFAPLTAALSVRFDWRETYLVLALILAVITVPGHLWGLRGPWPGVTRTHQPVAANPTSVSRSLPFLMLLLGFGLVSFTAFAVVINLVPLLLERGISAGTAAVALGLGGAGQVLGRVAYPALTRRFGVRTRTTAILLAIAGTSALLGWLTTAAALVAAAIIAGMARGLFTLLQATAISDRWGTAHYGQLSGILAAPITFATAIAPWAGTALAGLTGSYAVAFFLLAGIGVLGTAASYVSTSVR